MLVDWLNSIEQGYSVNPIIFAVLYFGTFIPCWYFVFRIIWALKNREVNKLLWYFFIELFLLALPYLYVLIWGRNIPFWVYIILALLIIIAFFSVIKRISKMLGSDQSAKSQMLWDVYAIFYGRATRDSIPHQNMFKGAIKALNLKKEDYLLDAGCGAGDLEEFIVKDNLDIKVKGIDFSSKMIDQAKKRFKEYNNICFKQADLDKKLSFKNDVFDGIVCISVLFSVPRVDFTLKEFNRVIKNGGRVVLIEPKPTFNMSEIMKNYFNQVSKFEISDKIKSYLTLLYRLPLILFIIILNKIMDKWAKEGKYKYLEEKELKAAVERAGLKVIKTTSTLANQDTLLIATK